MAQPTVHKSGPSLKMFLLILLFLGLADACIPQEVATEEKIKSHRMLSVSARLQTQSLRIPGANPMDFGEANQPPYDEQAVSGWVSPEDQQGGMSREEASHTFSSSPLSADAQRLPLEFLPIARASTVLKRLLSLQVLNEESSGCKEEVKFLPTATTPKKPLKKKTAWNGLRCAYMMVTFLFVSYNKGDWCYCHYCNPDADNR
ncbi:epididymal protein 13 [Capricornis sumatraensis]|uniref:epididymal protein 13 n=1 Tax=Capricornis sumatraensis TaxID=34865 RepID=UPI0036043269